MKNDKIKILLVDDDPDILEFIGYNLRKEGFTVFAANNGTTALKIADKEMPHLIILDVMMPAPDGFETCELMRKNKKLENSVIAFLTARDEDYSQIKGFDVGADDYIAKPIKPKVLISRVKALLKRYKKDIAVTENNSLTVSVGKLVVDKQKYKVTYNGVEIFLPKKEFALLFLLISEPGKVFTRDEIYTNVWGDDIVVGDRTIDVHIRKLRKKIPSKHIETVKGVGYKYILDSGNVFSDIY